jgi:hypothetical protein
LDKLVVSLDKPHKLCNGREQWASKPLVKVLDNLLARPELISPVQ